jgi:DNA-binding MarR family transcriptional regulator
MGEARGTRGEDPEPGGFQSCLPDRLLASPSGITRLTDRLVVKELVDRQVPDDNRRVVQVTLTELGCKRLETADRIFHDFLEHSFAGPLTGEELQVLRSLLRKLLEHNGAWAPDRCDPAPGAEAGGRCPR